MKIVVEYFFILILFSGCSKASDSSGLSVENPEAEKRILFIGNSHTHFNFGLPFHLTEFANSYNITTDIRMSAPGGFTLEDHLSFQGTLDLITAESWDYIILQENTFRAANESEAMLDSIEAFQELLSNTESTILLFKTWAYQNNPEMILALNEVYNDAKLLSGYNVVSIGTLWNDFMNTENINLYEGDGIHPNLLGTYLTSALFYKKLFFISTINDSNYNSQLSDNEASAIKAFVSLQNL